MKSNAYKSSLVKVLVFGLWTVVFTLSTTSRTQAQKGNPNTVLTKPMIALVSTGTQKALRIINTPGSRARLLRMLAHNARMDPKSIKLVTRGCGCTLTAQDTELAGFGSCMKGCLADAGASYFALIMCGGSCFLGIVPACALCTGLSVTVIEVCALGCAAYPGPYPGGGRGMIICRNKTSGHRDRAPLGAKLTSQPARTGS